MKELGDILAALRGLTEPAVLVTVVAVEGSTYRRPGARMLVAAGLPGGRIGSISGGCLEDEACRRAWHLTEKGPSVVTYETGLDDGPGPGYTLGCGGRVTALFERVGPGLNPDYLRFVDRHRGEGRACIVATVIAVEGDSAMRIGDRPLLASEVGESVPRSSDRILATEAQLVLETSRSRQFVLDAPGGRAHVLVEVVPAPVHLFVFGTGHDAEPVASLASRLGWRVTTVGKKVSDSARARFGPFGEVIAIDAAAHRVAGPLPRRSAAIVMNHNYIQDSESIAALLGSNAAYIGILGPRHRTDAMLSDIASTQSFDAAGIAARSDLSRVHAPIGLDIGAETPEEVALAIVAEVQAFFTASDGGRLRDRPGAIHSPVDGGDVKVASTVVSAACPLDDAT